MKLSIMQPYIFPYIGYFHLIECTEKIVFYDDVQFVKKSWINRNRILSNNSDQTFTIPLQGASQNKKINEIFTSYDDRFVDKFLKSLSHSYASSPFKNTICDLVREVLDSKERPISEVAIDSILLIYRYLGKDIQFVRSSDCCNESIHLKKADRLIQICKSLGYHSYVNAIGGKEIYSKEYFNDKGIELHFVESKAFSYNQKSTDFVANLSIIDILMNNDIDTVKDFFVQYSLV